MNRGGFKVIRKKTTRVSSLPSYKSERPHSGGEPEISKQEVQSVESSVGDAFEEIFGERGEEVDPNTVQSSSRKAHIRHDDDDEPAVTEKEEPAKPKYSGPVVTEGINSTAKNDDDAGLDDLLDKLMTASEEESPKRPTSTPSKDDVNDADFGDLLSFVTGDDDETTTVDRPKEKKDDEPKDIDTKTTYGKSPYKPSFGDDSKTTTTIKTSYSSKSVPRIPLSFYKDLQCQLEDLIFKFECLDNEYAALQRIGHNIYVETLEVKKKMQIDE